MVAIFGFSHRQNLGTGLGIWDLLLRKLAHMTEYGVLWFLLWWAFRYRHLWVAAAITVLYAISDEIHQHFVATRHGSPLDVVVDTAGMAVAIGLALIWRERTDGVSVRSTEIRSDPPPIPTPR